MREYVCQIYAVDVDHFTSPSPSEIWCAEEFAELTPYFRTAIEVCEGNYEYLSYLANQVCKHYLPFIYICECFIPF